MQITSQTPQISPLLPHTDWSKWTAIILHIVISPHFKMEASHGATQTERLHVLEIVI